MIVTFDKDALCTAVTPAMSAVANKNTITAIEGIRLTAREDGSVILNSFDLEKGIEYVFAAEVTEPGSYIINGQKFNQIIRSMPDRIRIEINEQMKTSITSGKSEFTMNAIPGHEFPNTPELVGDIGFTIPACELRDAITKTLYAVASNEPRPALNGIFFRITPDHLTLVSSDSFRLAVCEKEIRFGDVMAVRGLDAAIIVPGKTIAELYKMLPDDTEPVRILATAKHIIFKMGPLSFFSRLIDAEYVNYEKFIPKDPVIHVSVPTKALLSSLERASLVTEDRALGQAKSSVRFTLEDQCLYVSAVSVNGTVNDEIPVEKTGPDLRIGFNCRFLLDALRACDSEYIKLALVSPLVSMVITADEDRMSEEDKKERDERREKVGILSERDLHLAVPCHMRD